MDGATAEREWLAEQWASPPTEFAAEHDGARLTCRGWNLDAADLPAIVLCHGFRAHARWWDHIGPALAETHRVVAFDFSGMGDSDRRQAYSRELHGREILAVATAAGFDRAIVVAHSYGALCAMIATRLAADRVSRLIVIDSAVPTEEEAAHQIPATPLRIYPDRESAVSRFRLIPPGEWPQPDVLAYIAQHAVRETPDGWTWKFDENAAASLNDEDYRPKLFGVPVPCDVVYGDRTEIMPPARRAQLAEMAPHSGRAFAIPAAHHHVPIEQPLALVAVLRALLANDRA